MLPASQVPLPLTEQQTSWRLCSFATVKGRQAAGCGAGQSPSAAHISSGLLPSEYRMDKKPLWKELWNIGPRKVSPCCSQHWRVRSKLR